MTMIVLIYLESTLPLSILFHSSDLKRLRKKRSLYPKSLPLQIHESIWASLHFLSLALVVVPMLPKILHQNRLTVHRIPLKRICAAIQIWSVSPLNSSPKFFAKFLWRQLSISRFRIPPFLVFELGISSATGLKFDIPASPFRLRTLCHRQIRLILDPTKLNGSLISVLTSVIVLDWRLQPRSPLYFYLTF